MQAEIKAYIQSLPDNERWKDFFDASTGKTIIDIVTGIAELMIYKLEIRSLDSYLPTAVTQSAVYLLAQMVGYNPNRKSRSIGEVTVNFTYVPSTNIIIPEGFVFDSAPIPLVSRSPILVKEGTTSAIIPVMQGEWRTAVFSRDENNLIGVDWETVYLDVPNFKIDQNEIYVSIDGVNCKIVDKIEQVDETSVLIRTDYRGGVLILFGDGVYGIKVSSSSVVEVTYLYTEGLSGIVYKDTDIGRYFINDRIFNAYVSSSVQGGSNEDSIDKVKFLASRFYQTQGRAVTAYDYEAVVMSYPGIISAKCKKIDEECCTICISAIKDSQVDYSKEWTDVEVDDLLKYLDDYKMVSTKIEFFDPEPIPIDLTITLVVKSTLYSSSSLDQRIEDYIKNTYCYKLGYKIYSTMISGDVLKMSNEIIRVAVNDLNDRECYPDIALECNQYFYPRDIVINKTTQ